MPVPDDFGWHYRMIGEAVLLRIEKEVIGSDYGASSYTTRDQADKLAELLDLAPGMVFLDIGSGAGWPGIYMAHRTGSRVLLSDPAVDGLNVARRRLDVDGMAGDVVAAGGDLLPFRAGSIDAVTSSDALC